MPPTTTANTPETMAKDHKHHASAVHVADIADDFQGYTLPEIHYRKAVNRLKIDIQKERLAMIVNPTMKQAQAVGSTAVGTLERAMNYLPVALLAFRAVRSIVHTVRSHRK